MKEGETIAEFNVCLCYINNSYFALGDKILDEKVTRKILISLSKRFDMKVTDIEETQYVTTVKVDELIGSLLTLKWQSMINPRKETKVWKTKLALKKMRNM